MNYTIPFRFHLVSRNEGKIKSYESCIDIRAWSHDVEDRSSHLRAWIRSDMPFCVIPSSTLAGSLRMMCRRNRGRLTPRCHPNCKSKVVLESICSSCHAIKECLQNNPEYEKYFEEEELVTSHWPCDRCLEALKSIKMYWRIIMEKLFCVNIPKNEKLPLSTCNGSVQNTAKTWQDDILNEVSFVKNMMPLLHQNDNVKTSSCLRTSENSVIIPPHFFNTKHVNDSSTCTFNRNDSFAMSEMTKVSEEIKTNRPRKVNRSISVKIKKFDVGCEPIGDGDNDVCKNNLCELQQRFNEQSAEVERLKKENLSLNLELQNINCGFTMDSHICAPSANLPTHDTLAVLPKPFDDDHSDRVVNDVDSEMIITMKNCKHSKYKQVSFLQVLHKTNQPMYDNGTDTSCRKEDPLHVLTRVQTAFGAIVQREMGLVGDKQRGENTPSDIKAFYHKVKNREPYSKLDRKSSVSVATVCECKKDDNE